MADYSDLLKQIPVADIAKQVGVDPSVAESAINQILPTLVAGLDANAKTPAGAASLEKALASHTGKKVTSVSQVDTADGAKIVNNVFGSNKDEVAKAVASKTPNATQQIIATILPIVAPIVIAWVANQFLGGAKTSTTAAEPSTSTAASAAGGIGGLLGSVLGSAGGQEVIGSVLGSLLGGGKK